MFKVNNRSQWISFLATNVCKIRNKTINKWNSVTSQWFIFNPACFYVLPPADGRAGNDAFPVPFWEYIAFKTLQGCLPPCSLFVVQFKQLGQGLLRHISEQSSRLQAFCYVHPISCID